MHTRVRILSPALIPLHKKTTLAFLFCFLKPSAVGACSALLRKFTVNSNASFPIFPILWKRPKWHQGTEPACVRRPGLRSIIVWPQWKQIPQGSGKVVDELPVWSFTFTREQWEDNNPDFENTVSVNTIRDNIVCKYNQRQSFMTAPQPLSTESKTA